MIYWFSFTHSFALAFCLVTLAHVGGGTQWAFSTLGLHTQTADHVRGRVMALDYGFATLCLGASASTAGVLADTSGEVATLHWLAAIGAPCGSISQRRRKRKPATGSITGISSNRSAANRQRYGDAPANRSRALSKTSRWRSEQK